MKHIFYFVGLCLLIYEILWLINLKEFTRELYKIVDFRKNRKENDNVNIFDKEYGELWFHALISLIFMFWSVIGILSFNWLLFLILIFGTVIHSFYIHKFRDKNNIIILEKLHLSNTLFIIICVLLIILNSYHFKITIL